MATVKREIVVELPSARVWHAVRDFGEVHRMVPGFLTGCRLEDGARVVTFGNGLVARELLVSCDDAAQRLVWAVVGTPLTHHNGAMQVQAEGARARVEWIADFLPDGAASTVAGMMEQSLQVMKRTLEAGGGPV